VTGGTGRTFYARSDIELGTVPAVGATPARPTDSVGCCGSSTAGLGLDSCAIAITNSGPPNRITNRMIWGPTDSTAAPYTTNTLMHVHTDLIIAATN